MVRRGFQGVSFLILFIAAVVIAAMATAVTIVVANSLKTKARLTSDQVITAITEGVDVLEVYGLVDNINDASGRKITNVSIRIRLSPGSDPLKFEDMQIVVPAGDHYVTYTFNNDVNDLNDFSWPSQPGSTDTKGNFTVTPIIKGTGDVTDHYLDKGEVVEILLAMPQNYELKESEVRTIKIIFGKGKVIPVEVRVPDALTEKVVTLG